ncbi:MAG: CPBP family intramembrane metalloprotease [Deltaproteobacteria bacterium]|nr:CPBP family intramembrane metalloprotease [Deltaproteobacteria bacterium]
MLLHFPKNLIYFVVPLGLYFLFASLLQKPFGLWGISLAQLGCLALPAYWGRQHLAEKQFKTPNIKDVLLTLLLTFFAIWLINILMSIQENFYPMPQALEQHFEKLMQMQSTSETIAKTIILTFTPAICEEMLFRGFLQPLWKKDLGQKGILLATFFFALCHGNFLYFHFYFLLGLFLAGLKEWKQNLWLCILAHLLNNLCTLFTVNPSP